jgi:AraC-like DNA-binding protein
MAIPFVEDLTARAFGFNDGPGAILAAIVEESLRAAPSLQDDAADSIAAAIPHVIASATATLRFARDCVDRDRLRVLHLQRIRRFVLENIGEPELDTARIATGVRLSRRYVQELFANESTTLMRWVWQERLARARQLITAAAHMRRQITEIAYTCGFSDVAHFSRAFRREFGVSPRDCRASSQQQSR